ncbi:MAG: glycosyltransferase family 2 protein [Planctomycetaceae bacterium]
MQRLVVARSDERNRAGSGPIELSVVIPCLNEAETIGGCVVEALEAMQANDICGEVIVSDNGSTDGSVAIAKGLGARIVRVAQRGYGAALMGGINATSGSYVIMADADHSYDFREIPRFLDKLRAGFDLVQGCRLPRGGGRVLSGAMPPMHRWIGNPALSWLVRFLFRAPVNDVYCGMRGFRTEKYRELDLRCVGMEFANEMIVKSSLFGQRIAEVPITLHRDGRINNRPHLRTFRDGWRTLRFLLMCTPRYLFIVPSIVLFLLGLLGYAAVYCMNSRFGGHTLLFSSMAMIVAHQAGVFGVVSRCVTVAARILPPDPKLNRFLQVFSLERGILFSLCALLMGAVMLGVPIWRWISAGFGELSYERNLLWVAPGMTFSALGVQTLLASFLMNLIEFAKLGSHPPGGRSGES